MPLFHCRTVILLAVLLPLAGCGAVRSTTPAAESRPAASDLDGIPPAEAPLTEAVEVLEEFWPDGGLRIRHEVIRDAAGDPVDHGTYTRWHENGRKEYETIFDHGRKNGRAVRYHMNGRVWIEEFYVLGLKEGACRTWNEEGDLVKEEQYSRGKPHGTWTVWEEGKVRARSCFDHGVPVDCPPEPANEQDESSSR